MNAGETAIPRGAGRAMKAYRAAPEGDGPFPGVIVIHEILGLNQNIREIAERFAAEGYAALAVDLFSTGNPVACMLRILYGILLNPLDNATVGELKNAIRYWQAQPFVDPRRVGCIGFCMGGTYALQLAVTEDDVRVASVFYGMNPRPLDKVAAACPIVGSYPEKDYTRRAAEKLERALRQHAVPHDVKIYEGTYHSFFNDRGRLHSPQAAADAWRRTLDFFADHM